MRAVLLHNDVPEELVEIVMSLYKYINDQFTNFIDLSIGVHYLYRP
jgi:hypothetical protein